MAKGRVRPHADDDISVIRHDKGGKLIEARQRSHGWTPERRRMFLATLADTCNVSASCRAAGMSTGAIYPLRQRDAAFRAAWADALREGYQRLELAMLDRAINGVEKPVHYHGERIATVREFNDAVGARLLSHHAAAAAFAQGSTIDEGVVAEARLTIERRVRAIKLRRKRVADNADQESA